MTRHNPVGDCFARSCFGVSWLARPLAVAIVAGCACWLIASTASAQLTALRIENYAEAPITGIPGLTSGNPAQLARINFLDEEPGGSDRLFVNDLNGPLYILDKQTRAFTQYLNFNGSGRNSGLFDRFTSIAGFANGLVTFEFDPDYGNNGKFYTVHMEELVAGSTVPDNSSVPGLNTSGYTSTTSIPAPGSTDRETVLIEWTDTNISNNTFEGTARELLRLDTVNRIHPLGDLAFNPTAGPGDPDWRVMYLAVGDGGAGEQSVDVRLTPQRFDTLNGKILRIIPDLNEHTDTSIVSGSGRYRIPDDNPFHGLADAHGEVYREIFALGLRNPHRISWDVDPADPSNHQIIVNDIGLHTWEEVNIIRGGGNYGYSQREGNEMLLSNNMTTALPNPDTIPIQINATMTDGTVTPIYPVLQYGHEQSADAIRGDAISSGFVYRGSKIPQLYGKYLFADITTGQILYANYDEMLAADDGDPSTLATIHSLDLIWDDPNDSPDGGAQTYATIHPIVPGSQPEGALLGPLFQIVDAGYHARGGSATNLPGGADVTAPFGRGDVRLAMDGAGELYLISKSDGVIRAIVGVPEPASAGLMGIAALVLAALRRRRGG